MNLADRRKLQFALASGEGAAGSKKATLPVTEPGLLYFFDRLFVDFMRDP